MSNTDLIRIFTDGPFETNEKNCTGQFFFMFLTLSIQLFREFSFVMPVFFWKLKTFLTKGQRKWRHLVLI